MEKPLQFKTNGATPLRYKAQFGKDYFKEILKLAPLEKLAGKKKVDAKDLEVLDFEVFYNIAWIMAKTANPDIPDPITWLEEFEEFPMAGNNPRITRFDVSIFSNYKKKVNESNDGEALTTELFQVMCYQCHLTKDDLELMTIGNCLDYLQEYIESQNPKKVKTRKASQSDFDSF